MSLPQGRGGTQPYYLANSPHKMHEHDEFLVDMGEGDVHASLNESANVFCHKGLVFRHTLVPWYHLQTSIHSLPITVKSTLLSVIFTASYPSCNTCCTLTPLILTQNHHPHTPHPHPYTFTLYSHLLTPSTPHTLTIYTHLLTPSPSTPSPSTYSLTPSPLYPHPSHPHPCSLTLHTHLLGISLLIISLIGNLRPSHS